MGYVQITDAPHQTSAKAVAVSVKPDIRVDTSAWTVSSSSTPTLSSSSDSLRSSELRTSSETEAVARDPQFPRESPIKQWTGKRAPPSYPKTRSPAYSPKLPRQRPIGSLARESRTSRLIAQRAPSCPTTTTPRSKRKCTASEQRHPVEKAEQERPRRHRPRVLFPRGSLRQIHRRLPGLPQINVAPPRKTPRLILEASLLRQPQNKEPLQKPQQSCLTARGRVGLHVS